MPRSRITLAGIAFLMLAACGGQPESGSEEEQAAADAAATELGRDTDETVFDDMIQTQDKARAVEDLTLGRKNELDAAMEDAEGSAPADQ
jgi:basic membrane lipoprotein Med (substrate-binding protein (PBP1-ABC) superfamily)